MENNLVLIRWPSSTILNRLRVGIFRNILRRKSQPNQMIGGHCGEMRCMFFFFIIIGTITHPFMIVQRKIDVIDIAKRDPRNAYENSKFG